MSAYICVYIYLHMPDKYQYIHFTGKKKNLRLCGITGTSLW